MTWTRIENDLVRKPEVLRMARTLGISKPAVVGHLALFWNWCIEQMDAEGHISGTGVDADVVVDDAAMLEGFADALVEVGWLRVEPDFVVIPNPDRFMDFSKKRKAADRNRAYRARKRDADDAKRDVTQASRKRHADVTQPSRGRPDDVPSRCIDGDGDEEPPPTPPEGGGGGEDFEGGARKALGRTPTPSEVAQWRDLLEYARHPDDGRGIRSPDAFAKARIGSDWTLPADSKLQAARSDERRSRLLLEETRRRNRELDAKRKDAISLAEYRERLAGEG